MSFLNVRGVLEPIRSSGVFGVQQCLIIQHLTGDSKTFTQIKSSGYTIFNCGCDLLWFYIQQLFAVFNALATAQIRVQLQRLYNDNNDMKRINYNIPLVLL